MTARRQAGFTLIEAIIVIVITGILAAMVAVFLRAPIQGYLDQGRRAQLTDGADTAYRRLARDLRLALPNSVRVSPDGRFLEFILTRAGGRYRSELTGAGAGDILDFTSAPAGTETFDVLGPAITFEAGDEVVIYNLGIAGADAYAGASAATHNRRPYSGATGTPVSNVQISSSSVFPLESPGRNFQVVNGAVSYVCELGSGTGTLTRYSGYGIPVSQPLSTAAAPLAGAPSALLARDLSACGFSYSSGASARLGLVTVALTLSREGESVSLYAEAHVNNVP